MMNSNGSGQANLTHNAATDFQPDWGRSETFQCSDGVDNDGDGKIDFPADPGCTSAGDNSEGTQCSDGVDNDGDGKVDYPTDPGCSGPNDNNEQSPQCSDGIDNDGDGKIDYPADPGCTGAGDNKELDVAVAVVPADRLA